MTAPSQGEADGEGHVFPAATCLSCFARLVARQSELEMREQETALLLSSYSCVGLIDDVSLGNQTIAKHVQKPTISNVLCW